MHMQELHGQPKEKREGNIVSSIYQKEGTVYQYVTRIYKYIDNFASPQKKNLTITALVQT